jgi:hypothetical protein
MSSRSVRYLANAEKCQQVADVANTSGTKRLYGVLASQWRQLPTSEDLFVHAKDLFFGASHAWLSIARSCLIPSDCRPGPGNGAGSFYCSIWLTSRKSLAAAAL